MSDDTTHFGFETVTHGEKTARVRGVFDRVASRYDIMNDVMSFGLHHLWKRRFLDALNPQPGEVFLDVAGGTGDIAMGIVARLRALTDVGGGGGPLRPFSPSVPTSDLRGVVTVCDINQSMIEAGRARCLNRGFAGEIDWVTGDGAALPFLADTFDAYTISFGLRNVTEPHKAIAEAYRVLKPGGRFFCLEFSKIRDPLVKKAYDIYGFSIIPRIGQVLAGDRSAYQYLSESIEQFMAPDVLRDQITDAGFRHGAFTPMMGGLVAIHQGVKG